MTIKEFKKKVLCDIFGRHNGKGDTPGYHPGDALNVNLTSKCSRCGKEVIQNSRGNWFITIY